MKMITYSMHFFLLILPQPFYPDMVSKCDICNKTVKSSSELGRHVRIVHEKQRHECGICKKLFTRKYTLTNHEKLHTRSNDRQCTKIHHEEGLHDQHDQVCIQ